MMDDSTARDWVIPRSILFVPADRTDLITKALAGDADAICLDLEDGVAPANKAAARAGMVAALDNAAAAQKTTYVRVNVDRADLAADLAALAGRDVPLLYPKFDPQQARARRDGLGHSYIAMIEDLASLQRCLSYDGGCPDGVMALALGGEDLSADLGVVPNPLLLTHALYDLVKLGRLWDLPVLGLPCSIAHFTDRDGLETAVAAAAALGVTGAFCIHPAQIAALNDGFAPSAASLSWAEGVVALAAKIRADGVATHPDTGAMIDAPVLRQAHRLLDRHIKSS